jgi:CRISPR/Cas system-associated exonuclease Cas4 (RecB family)
MAGNDLPLISTDDLPPIITQQKVFIKDAIYVSYTALNDFLNCPRAYYLKNIYRDSRHDYRLQIASPYLNLGSLVHDTIRWYLESSDKPSVEQTLKQFRNFWGKYRGKRGGFVSLEDEASFGKRGLQMLENFLANADVLGKSMPVASFPKFRIVDNLLLIGNMDYVESLPDGTLHIVDFKTGSKDEDSPLQLYIYAILAENYYHRKVTKVSFWYLDRESKPKEVVLEPLQPTVDWLVEKGVQLKQAITNNNWICKRPDSPCRDCQDYTAVIEGKGEFLFTDEHYKKEVFFLDKTSPAVS